MLLEALIALATVLPRLDAGLDATRARLASAELPALHTSPDVDSTPPALPYFSATARAVSNWRDEAGAALLPASLALVAKYAPTDPGFVARCVKLNNYWCIKQARWRGELGGDGEGHTGFATAADGADAAATLLRRYYREFGRRTALAIVRRWAPAECGLGAGAARALPAREAAVPPVAKAVAPQGIGKTLRARFLARHTRGGAPRRVAAYRGSAGTSLRVQPWSARARLAGHPARGIRAAASVPAPKPVADIAAGIGPSTRSNAEKPPVHGLSAQSGLAPPPKFPLDAPAGRPTRMAGSGAANPSALLAPDKLVAESAALPSIVAGLPGGRLLDLSVPAPLCSTDETRIRNYASRIAASVGLKPEDDLKLFEADGIPTARLAPVMLAMSAVELGSLRASPALVAAAIGRMGLRLSSPAAAAAE
ncbi:hypothetical protein [Methylobacterium gnaphalii]|uniref:Uncharacterized protein n=1 Tax=Methylobacterium gnaphalii TaxID=1010610 RepID=A0A512JK26_9HYPH|nr:hypothetical protein [Methylobacterium gnaphalii]GEP10280.1 hypothetical protein MGN01_21250 [Methylobacterium gnaphalii]GJD68634.1 hypothetical protein MMMDOFMJ_1558 [Methylobacterium gnaphalii]